MLHLLKKRQFLPFFLTQFFGAFNDNAFKLAILTLISYHLTKIQAHSEYYQAIAGALFILPFFLFSATAGQFADKFDKSKIIRTIKAFEIVLVLVGSAALYYGNIFWMMATLFGMGIHSSFFGPIKYAILPDHLPKDDLLGATGLVDASTFLAILLGSILGTLAIGVSGVVPYAAIILIVAVALIGFVTSLLIPKKPSSLPDLQIDWFFWRSTWTLLKKVTVKKDVFLTIIVISWFWMIGGVFLTKLPDYTHYVLGADTHVFALFLALFSMGIALGSLMVNAIYQGRVKLLWVPLAMLGFTVFSFDLYWISEAQSHESLLGLGAFFAKAKNWRIAFDLLMSAFCAGLFVVPLYTYLQITASPQTRARMIAANNIYNALFMVFGTLLVMLALHCQASIPELFLVTSLLNAVLAFIVWLVVRKGLF